MANQDHGSITAHSAPAQETPHVGWGWKIAGLAILFVLAGFGILLVRDLPSLVGGGVLRNLPMIGFTLLSTFAILPAVGVLVMVLVLPLVTASQQALRRSEHHPMQQPPRAG